MPVQVVLDKPRTLKFDIRATRDLEGQYGRPLGTIIQDITNLGVTAIISALNAGLKHEDKAMSLNFAEKLLISYTDAKRPMRDLVRSISDALEETGLFEDGSEGNAQPEAMTTHGQ